MNGGPSDAVAGALAVCMAREAKRCLKLAKELVDGMESEEEREKARVMVLEEFPSEAYEKI